MSLQPSLLRLLAVAATCVALHPGPAPQVPPAAAAQAAAQPVPRTVILGFDGMDFALTRRWIDEGRLPNFERLAAEGLFTPLQTSNPAQSPVSWAVFNTGCNPGKTGVAGFVSRTFSTPIPAEPGRPAQPSVPQPLFMLGFPDEVPARDFVAFPMALDHRAWFLASAAAAGLAAGLLAGGLLRIALRKRLALRSRRAVLLLAGLAGAAGGFSLARHWADGLPPDGMLPYVVNPMQGTNFWTYLDRAGVRLRGVQVSSTYPPDDEGDATTLLSGLGVSDIGGVGTWLMYSDKPLLAETRTPSGGRLRRLAPDPAGRAEGRLVGPRDWIEQGRRRMEKRALVAERDDPATSADRRRAVLAAIARVDADYAAWNRSDASWSTVDFGLRLDRSAQAVDFDVGGRAFRVEQGGWSDFIPVEFAPSAGFRSHGLARFHVVRCDREEVRIFVPPIGIDPLQPPPQLPLSAPPGFAAELQQEIGQPYDPTGWACITNAMKDAEESRLPEQSFLEDVAAIEGRREEMLMAGLDRADSWDVYYQVFAATDRVAHMLFREADPDHPLHDPALAATEVRAFGATFPLRDAILQAYVNADRIVGRVLDRLHSGSLGEHCLLLVVSDHGFTSFRRQVNLNNVLHDLGYLAFRSVDDEGKPVTLDVASILKSRGRLRDALGYVDWSRTRAYSLGLGEVFVNLAGREPLGIVPAAEYDALIEQLRADLIGLRDPDSGARVVTSISRRDELYTGTWWKEGPARRKVRGALQDVWNYGFADLFGGYQPGYRASWTNTIGGLETEAITDNDSHWSGDHVSVDPRHVPGILLGNRRFTQDAQATLLDFGPTVLARYGIDPAPPHTDMDGHPLPFENPGG